MHQFAILRDLVILVAVAIPVVALAHRLKVPTVVGFLLTGMLIGPSGLGLIAQSESVTQLAEVGVVLLLFSIGLELSLSRILKLGAAIMVGGAAQVGGTIAITAVVAAVMGLPANQAVFVGALAALSSTAVVLKIYHDRQELDTPHGRVVVAILLFQDLCVVPLMILVPVLAGTQPNGPAQEQAPLIRIAVALFVTALLILGGRIAVPRLLERVAALRNREIFTLFIVLIGLSAAYLTASFGMSLALGAFIAGLVISESPYGIQALSDILPFRDTFSGIFFISVGMLLDIGFVANEPLLVGGATLALVTLKAGVAAAVVRSLRRPLQVSLMGGLALAQVGEFSFVLAAQGAPLGLLTPEGYQVFLGASVISMLATPFVIGRAPSLAGRLAERLGREPVAVQPSEEAQVERLADHVLVVGYGLNGRNLARVLKSVGIPYVVLEMNGQVVRQARLLHEPIVFGDATRHEVLEKVGIGRARAIVFAISAPSDERRGVAVARHLNPRIWILVRTRYVSEIEDLLRLGADQVIPEEFETSLEIFSRVLRLYGLPSNVIRREVEAMRGEHYEMLRGLSLPTVKLDALSGLGVRAAIETVEVEPDAAAVGQTLASLALRRKTGCTALAAVRDGQVYHTLDADFRFDAGDVVVLVGTAEALEKGVPVFRSAARYSGTARVTGIFRGAGER